MPGAQLDAGFEGRRTFAAAASVNVLRVSPLLPVAGIQQQSPEIVALRRGPGGRLSPAGGSVRSA